MNESQQVQARLITAISRLEIAREMIELASSDIFPIPAIRSENLKLRQLNDIIKAQKRAFEKRMAAAVEGAT